MGKLKIEDAFTKERIESTGERSGFSNDIFMFDIKDGSIQVQVGIIAEGETIGAGMYAGNAIFALYLDDPRENPVKALAGIEAFIGTE